jgi:hypothetical protein
LNEEYDMGGAISKLTKLAAPILGAVNPLGPIKQALELVSKVLPALGEVGSKTSPKNFQQLDEKLTQARATGRLALDGANAFLADPVKGTKEFKPKTTIQP